MIEKFTIEKKNIDCVFSPQSGLYSLSNKTTINIELVENHDSKKDVTKNLYQELITYLTKLLNSEATK